jgi:hypothetical protein
MKSPTSDRSSLTGALAMPCVLLSLASGAVSLVVAFMLWWGTFPARISRIGENAGLFSAALGLVLAGIGLASERKSVRRIAFVAIAINLAIFSFTIDTIFKLFR